MKGKKKQSSSDYIVCVHWLSDYDMYVCIFILNAEGLSTPTFIHLLELTLSEMHRQSGGCSAPWTSLNYVTCGDQNCCWVDRLWQRFLWLCTFAEDQSFAKVLHETHSRAEDELVIRDLNNYCSLGQERLHLMKYTPNFKHNFQFELIISSTCIYSLV